MDGRPYFVALALAFFLIRRDPVASAGGDVLQAQKISQRRLEQGVAALADIRSRALRDLVQVTARTTHLRALGR